MSNFSTANISHVRAIPAIFVALSTREAHTMSLCFDIPIWFLSFRACSLIIESCKSLKGIRFVCNTKFECKTPESNSNATSSFDSWVVLYLRKSVIMDIKCMGILSPPSVGSISVIPFRVQRFDRLQSLKKSFCLFNNLLTSMLVSINSYILLRNMIVDSDSDFLPSMYNYNYHNKFKFKGEKRKFKKKNNNNKII